MSEIIKPQFRINLDLFTRVIPSIRVNDRIIRLDTIEHVEYEAVERIGDLPEQDRVEQELAITFQSGNVIYLDQEEERELQAVLEQAIATAEQAAIQQQAEQQKLMQQAAQDALVRASLNPGGMPRGFGGKRH